MEIEITGHNNDIMMKCMAEYFKNKTLAFFGLKTARIVDLAPTALPAIEARETRTDLIFLMADETLLHMEFQTTASMEDLKRFLLYDARLIRRQERPRSINTVVIYSGDIQKAPEILDGGSIFYRATNVYMKDYDGDAEYNRIHRKVTAGEPLDDEDLMKMVFLPLMRSSEKIKVRAIQALELAKQLQNARQRIFAMSGIIVVTDKHLTEDYKKRLLEVLKMTQIEQWIREEGREEGKKEGRKEIAKTALKEGADVEFIVKITGLDKQTVLKLKEELN